MRYVHLQSSHSSCVAAFVRVLSVVGLHAGPPMVSPGWMFKPRVFSSSAFDGAAVAFPVPTPPPPPPPLVPSCPCAAPVFALLDE